MDASKNTENYKMFFFKRMVKAARI